MHDKIKELTDKIHRDGVEKANKEASGIIQSAEKEAEALKDAAKKEAEKILNEARKKSEDISRRIESEVRISAKQAIMNLRKEISELIMASTLKEPLSQAFDDQLFIRKLLETLVENWNPEKENNELQVMLHEEQLSEMEEYLKTQSGMLLNQGLSLKEYNGSGKGFEIQPKNGHYKINITDEAFEIFLKEHFKPQTLNFLFGGSSK
jgi:V/A-type H+-transporting ATPase subunit E